MATFYPNFKTILASTIAPTNTELKLLTFLRDTLNAKYEVYYRPNINGDMPQIIILKKGAGVLLLETCDYNLENYELNSRSKWKIKGIESIVKSPFDKVLEYKQNIFNLHIPNLLEQRLRKPLLWYIVHCAVYFSEEIEEDINNFVKSQLHKIKREKIEYIGKDQLSIDNFKSFLSRISFDDKSDNTLFSEDIYLDFKKQLSPDLHSSDTGIPITYSPRQIELSKSQPGEYKIKGVAGSGKTFVLAKRAVNAYKRTNGDVLILTYNITLKNYIRDRINDIKEDFDWKCFHINNYHDFFNSQMRFVGIEFDLPKDFHKYKKDMKDIFFYFSYYSNIELFENYKDKVKRYQTILIDEVQDYSTQWLQILKKHFLAENGEFVVFGDSKQNIYRKLHATNQSKDKVSLESLFENDIKWQELNETHRLTSKFVRLAEDFQRETMSLLYASDSFEIYNNHKDIESKILYKYMKIDHVEITRFIVTMIQKLSLHPNDVAVLGIRNDLLQNIDYSYRQMNKGENTSITCETLEYANYLKKTNEEYKIKDIRRNKRINFIMDSGLIKFSTIHNFKGWEIDTVFLLVEDRYIRWDNPEYFDAELIYTGFTRSMKNLILINLGSEEFEEFIKKVDYVEIL